jgi:hypothetical protein
VSPGLPDGTLIKGETDPKVYVTYGGAKFWIPSPAVFDALGQRPYRAGCESRQLPAVPRDGTLLKEQNNDSVYLMTGGARSWRPVRHASKSCASPPRTSASSQTGRSPRYAQGPTSRRERAAVARPLAAIRSSPCRLWSACPRTAREILGVHDIGSRRSRRRPPGTAAG